MSTYCRTHGRLYTEHACDRPHDPTPSERRDLADSTEWPPVERVRAAVASLNAQTGNPTPGPRKALTEPYSKPMVLKARGYGWFVARFCCDDLAFDPGFLDTHAEAFAEALAHAHGHAMDVDTLTDPVARQILDGETSDDDWLEVPTFTPADELAAVTCRCGRICCRHHHDDPDPAQAIWADIYNQPGGSRS